ncbi:cytochrome b5 domain-containing protein [Breznakiella homolactica]|uniref:Cytochrome b5 heme-binding domain-containing protein n=1 Tax=Breznakiella homolactica TaxID=2798577 RepID=A0A7T8BAH0_9SPIR|nr:cytochrome b5 domain-containing protein [Breznakiella homolactica]QQO10669.1 hypothetical protein JFL75_07060 [Breznakiella homolactica]
MKTNCRIIMAVLCVVLVAAAGCAQNKSQSNNQSGSAPAAQAGNTQARTFTAEELARYNGTNGNPAYVAVDGTVYDVTNVPQWAGGKHYQGLTAGKDLTEEIKKSPHGTSVLSKLPVVGTLKK